MIHYYESPTSPSLNTDFPCLSQQNLNSQVQWATAAWPDKSRANLVYRLAGLGTNILFPMLVAQAISSFDDDAPYIYLFLFGALLFVVAALITWAQSPPSSEMVPPPGGIATTAASRMASNGDGNGDGNATTNGDGNGNVIGNVVCGTMAPAAQTDKLHDTSNGDIKVASTPVMPVKVGTSTLTSMKEILTGRDTCIALVAGAWRGGFESVIYIFLAGRVRLELDQPSTVYTWMSSMASISALLVMLSSGALLRQMPPRRLYLILSVACGASIAGLGLVDTVGGTTMFKCLAQSSETLSGKDPIPRLCHSLRRP